ncbi:hypothetical protein B0H10DRAFT_374111 [Mycena sp. CBHHK59/15]|nr:hypothetical protein B0H10DRAFT_374111 [Mycena sp. CBHHK59/15]
MRFRDLCCHVCTACNDEQCIRAHDTGISSRFQDRRRQKKNACNVVRALSCLSLVTLSLLSPSGRNAFEDLDFATISIPLTFGYASLLALLSLALASGSTTKHLNAVLLMALGIGLFSH